VRIGWLEAACIVSIGVATLQLPIGERGARLFTPPALKLPLKEMLGANTVTAQHPRLNGTERKR
jgi:hypothetical protein